MLDERQVRDARDALLGEWGRVDILLNAAGGNVAASRNDDRSIFEVPLDASASPQTQQSGQSMADPVVKSA